MKRFSVSSQMVSSFWAAESVFSVAMESTCVWPRVKRAGAMDNGQHADFGAERTDLVHGAAVYTLAGEQPLLDDLLLQLVEDLVHVLHDLGMVGLILFLHRR